MTAHDQNDASNRINITNLTMASDCKNSPIIERSCEIEPASGKVSMALGCIDVGPLWRLLDDGWHQHGFSVSHDNGARRSSWAGMLGGNGRSRCRNAFRVSRRPRGV